MSVPPDASSALLPPAPVTGRGQLICLAGPLGVGKTTIAREFAAHLGAEFVPERYTENPFLARFYDQAQGGAEVWGYHTEMTFLFDRVHQASLVDDLLAAGKTVVCDWTFHQNLIYSRTSLSDADFALYLTAWERASRDVPNPDLLVVLTANLTTILQRIRGRGREMEASVDLGYIAALTAGYDAWRQAPPAPTRFVDTSNMPIPTDDESRTEAFGMLFDAIGYCPLVRPAAAPSPGITAPARPALR